MKTIEGGINSPKGFSSTGAYIGIKKRKKDLTLICSEVPAIGSAVFTKNIVKAPPVLWCQEIIDTKQPIKGIVINSGNANACTGALGRTNTEIMAETYAECLNCSKQNILVSSTGVIGVQLPIDTVVEGIKTTAPSLSSSVEAANLAAEGIMTTDTFAKQIAVECTIGGKSVKIGGIAKGSGMIHPNMATMLGFLTTDVNISQELLDKVFKDSIEDTYNMISVDGDTSTNDTVVIIANGMAENPKITEENEDCETFKKALFFVNMSLSKDIIRDGEGATKFLEVSVDGTSTKEDARQLCKSVLTSSLVKTAFFGQDANWGRILAAMGYSGVMFNQEHVTIGFQSNAGNITLFEKGVPLNFCEQKALEILKEKEINVKITLTEGIHKATGWGCDLSYDYVKINAEYRT